MQLGWEKTDTYLVSATTPDCHIRVWRSSSGEHVRTLKVSPAHTYVYMYISRIPWGEIVWWDALSAVQCECTHSPIEYCCMARTPMMLWIILVIWYHYCNVTITCNMWMPVTLSIQTTKFKSTNTNKSPFHQIHCSPKLPSSEEVDHASLYIIHMHSCIKLISNLVLHLFWSQS